MSKTGHDKIKVIIADDHAIVREGFGKIISGTPDLMVVGEAEDGVELLDKVRILDLDVVVLDVAMPKKSGWEVIAQLKVEFPHLPVIILSGLAEESYALEFFRAGASGYLNKATAMDLLVEAIRKVARGGKFVSPEFSEKLTNELGQDTEKKPHETLSTREIQVFYLIASGKPVKEIAQELSLSVPTINTYRTRILEKMKLKSNAQLIHYAFKNGLIS